MVAETVARTFDAGAHMGTIRTRQGQQRYLAVKHRILWLRSEHPDAQITVSKVDGGIEAGWVEFCATVVIPSTGASATDYGSETRDDFPDYFEKAATKATGRALALLGYGTDAAPDLDDGEPMDGLPAAKAERASRRMDDGQRRQVDAQHERNTAPAQPPPSRLPATRRAAREIGSAQDQPSPVPAQPTEDDAVLRDELRELGTRGFDLNRFLTGRNKELDDLTRGELEGILPAAREVVRKRVERLTQG